jgi:hypothetical protein
MARSLILLGFPSLRWGMTKGPALAVFFVVLACAMVIPWLSTRFGLYHGRTFKQWAEICDEGKTPSRRQALHVFEEALKDKEVSTRREAIKAMSMLKTLPNELTPALADSLLGDEDPTVRRIAAIALRRAGLQALGPLLNGLGDPDSDVRAYVGSALMQMHPPSSAIPELIGGLRDSGKTLMILAVLGDMGDRAKPAVPEIEAMLLHPELHVRSCAAWPFGR